MCISSQFAISYSTSTTYSIGSVIPHVRVKKVVNNYPVIKLKLVPLDL